MTMKKKASRFAALMVALMMALSTMVVSPMGISGDERGADLVECFDSAYVQVESFTSDALEVVAGENITLIDLAVSLVGDSEGARLLRYEILHDSELISGSPFVVDVTTPAALTVTHVIDDVQTEDAGEYRVVIYYIVNDIERTLFLDSIFLNVSYAADETYFVPMSIVTISNEQELAAIDSGPASAGVTFVLENDITLTNVHSLSKSISN